MIHFQHLCPAGETSCLSDHAPQPELNLVSRKLDNSVKMTLTSIRTDGDSIEIIDQLVLPHSYVWTAVDSPNDAYDAIKSMKIRGAPAIASLAALSVSSYLSRASKSTPKPQFLASLEELQEHLDPVLEHLYKSRPTAVNLGAAITRLRRVMSAGLLQNTPVEEVVQGLISEGRAVADEDVDRNKTMARLGAEWILRSAEEKQIDISNGVNVLTVCNTGSLATSGYGTALGIITYLHETGRLKRAYYTQSTPYHQGSRLTALELKSLAIASTMICDTMVGSLFQHYDIHAVVVGADRVARNGDTANKIGTYNAAVLAARHNIPFVVCCPVSTVDMTIADGSAIPIEHRPAIEACLVRGRVIGAPQGNPDITVTTTSQEEPAQAIVQVTPDLDLIGGGVYNPSFDVTPAELVSAIVTEKGVAENPTKKATINVGEVA